MGFSVKQQELLPFEVYQELDKLIKFLKQFLLREHNENGTHITNNPTSGVASASAAYVTIGNTSDLSAERALVGTANQVSVTDNGANSTVVLGTPQNINVGADVTFNSATLSGLTNGRVVIAGASGLLTGDADLTFSTDTLTATKISTTQVTDSGLTSGRVVIAGTGGLLQDDADLTFSTDTLTATKISTTQVTDSGLTSGRVVLAGTGGLLQDDGDLTFVTDTLTVTKIVGSTDLTLGGAAAAATTCRKLTKKVTGIADNTATDVLTITIPNANHAAALRLLFLSSNGGTDAFESNRAAQGLVVFQRNTGVVAVATAAAIADNVIATSGAGGSATHTLAYAVSAVSGAAGATNTFTITVTIDDSGNVGGNQVVIFAELLNSEATGITIS